MMEDEEDILDREVDEVFFESSTLMRMIGHCRDCDYWDSIDSKYGPSGWGVCAKLTAMQCSNYNYVICPYRDGAYIYDIERLETQKKFGCIYWDGRKKIVEMKKKGTIKRYVGKKSQSGGKNG